MTQQLLAARYIPPADFPPEEAISLGHHCELNVPVKIHRDRLTENLLAIGAVGSGKTVFFFWLIWQLIRMCVGVKFYDFKGESPRLLSLPGTMLFHLNTAPRNFLEPVGDRMAFNTAFVNELRDYGQLRPETYPLAVEIVDGMWRSVRPGQSYPCLEDLRRVTEHLGKKRNRENLYTIARTIQNLCAVLGRASRVRKAADVGSSYHASHGSGKGKPRYTIEAYNFVGCDPGVFRWWLGMEFAQLILGAQHYGHTTTLQQVLVIDEGLNVFAKELYRDARVGIASPKRVATTGRFTGTGLLVGGQNLTSFDPFLVQNAATLLVFQCNDADEAYAAAKSLGLPRERACELQALNKGEAFARSAGWPSPVKIRIPFLNLGDYPSAARVQALLAPELAWIEQHNEYATYPDASTPPIEFLTIVNGEADAPTDRPAKGAASLAADHYAFLRDIFEHPSDGLKARYQRMGLGIEKGNARLAQLKAAGCIRVTQVANTNPKGGRGRLVPVLTQVGQEVLEAHERTRGKS